MERRSPYRTKILLRLYFSKVGSRTRSSKTNSSVARPGVHARVARRVFLFVPRSCVYTVRETVREQRFTHYRGEPSTQITESPSLLCALLKSELQ